MKKQQLPYVAEVNHSCSGDHWVSYHLVSTEIQRTKMLNEHPFHEIVDLNKVKMKDLKISAADVIKLIKGYK